MGPSDCPDPWVHSPDDVRISYHDNIGVDNIWKNTETGEVVIQYMTITTVERNKYVEAYKDPDTVKSRLRQVKDLLSSDDVETELDSVDITGGSSVAKCRSKQKALQKALEYMRGEFDGHYYER